MSIFVRIRSLDQKKIRKLILFILLALAAVMVGFVNSKHEDTLIPQVINNKLNFQVILPVTSRKGSTIDKTSFKYDDTNKVLSFIAHEDTVNISVSEQSYPEILIYDNLVGTLNEYAEIQTKIGKVTLTHPIRLNGGQTAVLSTHNSASDILLFAKPDEALTSDQWLQFFNSMIVIK